MISSNDYDKKINRVIQNGNMGKELPLNKDGTINDILLFNQHHNVDLSKKDILKDDLPKWE